MFGFNDKLTSKLDDEEVKRKTHFVTESTYKNIPSILNISVRHSSINWIESIFSLLLFLLYFLNLLSALLIEEDCPSTRILD